MKLCDNYQLNSNSMIDKVCTWLKFWRGFFNLTDLEYTFLCEYLLLYLKHNTKYNEDTEITIWEFLDSLEQKEIICKKLGITINHYNKISSMLTKKGAFEKNIGSKKALSVHLIPQNRIVINIKFYE